MSEQLIEGGCLCGAIRMRVNREAVLSAHHCHCRDCQRTTGAAATTFFIIALTDFELLQGSPKTFSVKGTSGATIARSFCGDCGSPVFSDTSLMEGMRFVKAGAMDDASWVKPVSTFWAGSAQPWGHVDPDIEKFEGNPRL
jgi:hypothetical protein